MGKHDSRKPMTLDAGEFNEVKNSALLKDFKTEFEQKDTKVPVTEVINYKRQVLDTEAQEKLDQYDQITATNKALLKEKADLEAKIAEYIEEIAALKSRETKAPEIVDNSMEVAELKQQIEQLKQSSAQYLRRISDLTFENANLTAQLKELSSKSTQVQNTIPAMPTRETHLEKAPYNPYVQNGYSSWN